MNDLLGKVLTEEDRKSLAEATVWGAAASAIEACASWIPEIAATGLLPFLDPTGVGTVVGFAILGWRIVRRETLKEGEVKKSLDYFQKNTDVFVNRLKKVANADERARIEIAEELRRQDRISEREYQEQVLPLLKAHRLV